MSRALMGSESVGRRAGLRVGLAVVVALGVGGCSDDQAQDDRAALAAAQNPAPAAVVAGQRYEPAIDPASFSTTIDNPLHPLPVGRTWVYEGRTDEGLERIKVEVLPATKIVDGVLCVVVRDTARLDGTLIEDTYDWFAQDAAGNVWYFGEDTTSYKPGKAPDKRGSWAAGVDGARPGIVMRANPSPGELYQQEYYRDHAEGAAEVLRLGERARVPFGEYDNLLVTRDFNRLEPDAEEHKYYAPGIGMIQAVALADGEREVLVRMRG